jgi:hypothetical protein
MRRITVLLAALLLLPAAAHAASPRAIQVAGGIKDGNRTYVMKGQRVLLQGARPFADSGFVTATVTSHGHQVVARAKLRGAVSALNGVKLHFTAKRTGSYRIAIRVFKDSDPTHLVAGKVLTVWAVNPHVKFGQGGLDVRLLQEGLRSLAYVTPLGGSYGDATGRAVLAFRKVNGMARTETPDHSVFAALPEGRPAPRVQLDAPGARLRRRRQAGAHLPRILGQAVHTHRLRHLPLLFEAVRHQRQGHGGLELLHRRLRGARLRAGAPLRGQSRLHSRAGA